MQQQTRTFTFPALPFLLAFITSIVSIPCAARASENGKDSWVQSVEAAITSAQVEALQEFRSQLASRRAGTDFSNMDRYNLAYVNWRLCAHLEIKADRERLLEEGQKELEKVIQAEADNIEALSLLAGILGQRIGENPMRGMTLGSKSSSLLKKAARLAPNNPRAALQQGISYFHTPSMWGGGLDKAIRELERATALYAQQSAEQPWPHWGRLDALAWLGQALARQNRKAEARAVYQQALAINPNMGWIRHELLPALDSEGAAKR